MRPSGIRWCGFLSAAALLLGIECVAAAPPRGQSAVVKRQQDLASEYDFIVVGGGTAGLTIADRLTENGQYTVLVVEYGYLDDNPSILATGGDKATVPPNPVHPIATQTYNVTTLPIPGLAGKTVTVMAAAVVGGSSAINGFAFDRGTSEDYDAWVAQTGAARSQYAREWGWANLLPWFKKSATFHPPSAELAAELQITWDLAAWGGSTPLHAGFSPFQWKTQQAIFNAFKTLPGVTFPKEGANGNATGVFWFPNTINPADQHRSYARTAHYDPVKSRPNYHLLPAWRVTQVTMQRSGDEWATTGVLITPRDGPMPDGGPVKVKVKKEIIVSAGTIHTPQVLQRSGVGPRQVIEAANGTVRVELPGVGFNLQDHMYFPMNYTWGTPVYPDPTNLTTNATFAAEMTALWQTNKTGPLSIHVNTAAFLPFSVMTNQSRADAVVAEIRAQIQNPAAYLPDGVHPTIIAGYAEQLKVLAEQYGSRGSAVMEFPFSGNSLFYPIFIKPLSRGTVYLDPHDDGVSPTGRGNVEPLVAYRTRSNPVDMVTTGEMLRWVRRFVGTGAMAATFHPAETSPGASVTADADVQAYIAASGTPGNGHPSGTARIGPRELGGVLGPDLTVHGVRGLSVADCSVFPLIPGTHTSSTAYAIAEKAADMILKRASGYKSQLLL